MHYYKPALLASALLATCLAIPLVQSAPAAKSSESGNKPENKESLFTGRWKNQCGSTLELKEINDRLQGYFTTAVGKTKSCIGQPLAIQGATNKNALSVSFSMKGCGSPAVIALSGIIMKDKKSGEEKLKTQALIQFNGEEAWDSQVLTTDYYTRMKP